MSGSRVEHGTLSGYTNHGCRCEACRAAAAAYQRAYYEANKDEIAAYQRAYREANKPTGPLVRTCTVCGDEFEQERRQAHPFMRCEVCRARRQRVAS